MAMQTAFALGIAKNVNGRPSFHRAASAYQLGGLLPSSTGAEGLGNTENGCPNSNVGSTSMGVMGSSPCTTPVAASSPSSRSPEEDVRPMLRHQTSEHDVELWRRTSAVDKTNPFIGYFQMGQKDPGGRSQSATDDGTSVRPSSASRGPHQGSHDTTVGPQYYSAAFFNQQRKFAEWLGSQSIKLPSFFRRENVAQGRRTSEQSVVGKPPIDPRGQRTNVTDVQETDRSDEKTLKSQPLSVEKHEASSPPEMEKPSYCSRIAQDFEMLGPLGQGGQGTVFKARSRVDGCQYAIKKVQLSKSLRRDADTLDQALREVKSMAGMLPHANVVRYHTSWIEEDAPIASVEAASTTVEQGSCVAATQVEPCEEDPMKSVEPSFSTNNQSLLGQFTTYSEFSGGFDFAEPSESATTATLQDATQSAPVAAANRRRLSTNSTESEDIPMTLYIQMELCGTSQRPGNCSVDDEKFTLSMFFDRVKDEYCATSACDGKETHSTLTAWLRSTADERSSSPSSSVKHMEGLKLFLGIVHGVQHIHHCGVIHRDLKPDNIFIDGSIAKIGDFGLSKSIFAESYDAHSPRQAVSRSTSDGSGNHTTALGTFTYASPEQLGNRFEKTSNRVRSAKYSIKSDIFALGVILLELCCPFSTMMERSQVLTAVRHGVVPQKALQQYPTEMALVLRMTAVNPAERPTAEEIVDQISSLLAAGNQKNAMTALDELRDLQTRLATAVHQLRERSQAKGQLESLITELNDKVQNVGMALA